MRSVFVVGHRQTRLGWELLERKSLRTIPQYPFLPLCEALSHARRAQGAMSLLRERRRRPSAAEYAIGGLGELLEEVGGLGGCVDNAAWLVSSPSLAGLLLQQAQVLGRIR